MIDTGRRGEREVRKLTREQALRRGLKDAFCEKCGFEPANRSQAIAHAATCGSIVAPGKPSRSRPQAKWPMTTYHLSAGSPQHYVALARERGLPRHHGFDSWLRRGEKVRLLKLQRRAHPQYGEYLYSEWEFRWHGGEDRVALPLGLLLSDLPALKRKVLRSPTRRVECHTQRFLTPADRTLDLYRKSS